MPTPPRDLREWIALLEREGELQRISAEADPDLEITEIVDRVVKSGGPALLFENPKGSERPLLINQFGTERRMCLALGVEKLDDAAAKLGDILDMQPPEGIREKVRGPPQAEVGRRLPAEDRVEGALPGDLLRRRRRRPRPAPDPALLAGRPRAVHHAPGRHHEGSEDGHPQRRHVPNAGDRPPLDLHALADAQGRPSRSARVGGRAHPGRGRDRARPGDRVLGERAAPASPRRAHARRVPARRAGRARPLQDRRPRGARERGDRPRRACLEGRHGHRGPVRRPHGLLLARRAVPDLPIVGHDDAQGRDLLLDRRRQAARPRTPGLARRRSGSSCPPSG